MGSLTLSPSSFTGPSTVNIVLLSTLPLPFICTSLHTFLPSGSLMSVEQFEACHPSHSSACLSRSLSEACALSCFTSAAVIVF